jgi:hypothetical protein
MVIPTTYPALHDPEAYPNPDSFEPDRWITGDAEKQTKNWLVFGTGPHYCLGQTYATLHLMAMIGKTSMMLDWKHRVTPQSEEIKVFATIFPMVRYMSDFFEEDGERVLLTFDRMIACSRLRRGHSHHTRRNGRPEREKDTLIVMEGFTHSEQKQGDGIHRCRDGSFQVLGGLCCAFN